ncbi:MAG: FAD-dependent oxidoreductase, partial [Dehalococcoidales bacterium]|nr:FAD-dependent oxidoreductase [Dehalococcoidales bacterium]
VISAVRLDHIIGEQALRDGKIDFVGMTRRLLADPELPNKVMENRLEDIRPCLGCLHCMDVRLQNKYVQCRVNPQINRESEITYAPAEKKKKVLVVGAGPSGMEAARVAAVRGHEVSLYDKQPKLGGLIPLAGMLKEVEVDDMMDWVRWFDTQFTKLGVKKHLGQEVTPEIVSQMKPDVIIVAAGGRHTVPDIPGFSGAGVTTSARLHKQLKAFLKFFKPQTLASLTRLYLPVGKKVIVIGGKIQGCETAEFLVKRGRDVTIVDAADALGEGMTGDDKYLLFPWFDRKGVKQYLGVTYRDMEKGTITVTTKDGKEETLAADTIVTAMPLESNDEMMERFKDKAPEVYFIGDCPEPGLIAEATAAGALTASAI